MKTTKLPKRTYKINNYGNIVGYEGGKRVMEFGSFGFPDCFEEQQAKAWVNHEQDWEIPASYLN